ILDNRLLLRGSAMLTPTVISMLAFLGVSGAIGLLAFVFREQGPQTATRLDLLVGKRSRQEAQAADILRKSAFEGVKKSLVEAFMTMYVSIDKYFVQADCHSKPNTLFGVGLLLGLFGATLTLLLRLHIWLAPINGLILTTLPAVWLYLKRASRLAKFQAQLS